MLNLEDKKIDKIRNEAFKNIVLDSVVVYEDYQLFTDISPDQFMKFNDMMINIYKKMGILNYYLHDLDDYLDSLYFLAIFDDGLDIIDFNYFINRMIFLFNTYGHTEVIGYDFSKEKDELLKEFNSNIINIETYKEYKKIMSDYQ